MTSQEHHRYITKYKVKDGVFAVSILTRTAYKGSYWKDCKADPCVYCDGPSNSREHLRPASQGGTKGWENCVRACSTCNQARGNRSFLVYLLQRRQQQNGETKRRDKAGESRR